MQLAKYWQNCRTVAWTRWTHGAVFAKRRAFLPTNVEIMTDIEPEKTLWLSARTPGLRIRRHSLARNTTGTRPAPRSEQYHWVGIPLILSGAQYQICALICAIPLILMELKIYFVWMRSTRPAPRSVQYQWGAIPLILFELSKNILWRAISHLCLYPCNTSVVHYY